MAEFIEVGTRLGPRRISDELDHGPGDGFNAMGKPVPMYRRQAAYEHCKAMGMTDPDLIWQCVNSMSEQLARDEPYTAMDIGMHYLDLTGTYRLFAVLLTGRNMKEMG